MLYSRGMENPEAKQDHIVDVLSSQLGNIVFAYGRY